MGGQRGRFDRVEYSESNHIESSNDRENEHEKIDISDEDRSKWEVTQRNRKSTREF